MPADLLTAVQSALAGVLDPEIRRPITELGMVKDVTLSEPGEGADTSGAAGVDAAILVALTTAGCPLRETITRDVTAAVAGVPGIAGVEVRLTVMTDAERQELRKQLRGTDAEPVIPFAQPDSLTRVIAVSSGKGGVGKSTVTANLAVAMARRGLRVGVLDADIYGFSIPLMLGVTQNPTKVEDMILPPVAHDVKVISIGMFAPPGQPVVWRGPMLHRALQQFLADVFWGDLDILLLDLPPGTGDIAISLAQLLPNAEILVVTTPQQAAADVAARAGSMATQTRQRVIGVVENMSWLTQPDGSRLEIFGSGGGQEVANTLSATLGYPVGLLGQVPLDVAVREGGDVGSPRAGLDTAASGEDLGEGADALVAIADQLAGQRRGLAGRRLGLSVV
ncbi:ATP-binding protein involved in chromosome partitioning [Salana multivorans]|uniref:Iron-sulfur cluster carrier protein n=1 Tax=Salana multivorans TaxID=120377 RepID=A0A3N2DCI5_9MICO|nr:P-loop NTPase [Salana multivorans]OJX97889.1 MAG: sodium:proton antiporter [Micrococcales bacterium 73-15]ROR97501.1 ATP-binding protein involved in chromosome partitioning [Salana multivorans]